jgi:hypothetical protein
LIIMCIGRRRLGKSTLALFLAQPFPTRIFFDPKCRQGFFTSDVIINDTSDLYQLLDTESEIIIKPMDHVAERFEIACDQIKQWTDDNPEEKFSLLVDEARLVELQEKYLPQSFDYLLRTTLLEQCRIIITAHRPTDINPNIRAIADNWLMFRTTHLGDLKTIEERCGPDVVQEVMKLGPREFIDWNDQTGTWSRVTNSNAWYLPFQKREVPANV